MQLNYKGLKETIEMEQREIMKKILKTETFMFCWTNVSNNFTDIKSKSIFIDPQGPIIESKLWIKNLLIFKSEE